MGQQDGAGHLAACRGRAVAPIHGNGKISACVQLHQPAGRQPGSAVQKRPADAERLEERDCAVFQPAYLFDDPNRARGG